MLDIAKNYISDKPKVQCKSIGYQGMIAITDIDYQYVGTVQESTASIIFKGIDCDDR